MPAGGFKVFVDGEVLDADDINDYLMQGILVFSSEAARDSAISGAAHGMFAFTTDNNRLWYYDGVNWVDFSPDVEFASTSARDTNIPNPVDGRYAYTTDLDQLWKYNETATAWQQQPAAGIANFSNSSTGTYSSGGVDYKYVSFTSNGTLTLTQGGLFDVLLVGGGGGGGAHEPAAFNGGGGGGGGHAYITNAYLPAGSHSVTVGSGGATGQGSTRAGFSGNSSVLGPYIAVGGGGGGTEREGTGSAGGCGGGGGVTTSADTTGFGGKGFQGGNGGTTTSVGGGGGGGAGGNGGAGLGAGGPGLANSITGASVVRAGGGAGKGAGGGSRSGGSGGGGSTGSNGTNGLGGGGGGGGGSGGSGIVIVRVRTN